MIKLNTPSFMKSTSSNNIKHHIAYTVPSGNHIIYINMHVVYSTRHIMIITSIQ